MTDTSSSKSNSTTAMECEQTSAPAIDNCVDAVIKMGRILLMFSILVYHHNIY
ncbi:hypothetical protein GIB67_016769, partial [Kingdonia uniflora]